MALVLLVADTRFAAIDWVVVAAYLAIVVVIGVIAGRKRAASDDFFLAGRSMPFWAVAISVLATSLSAATFLGVPELSFRGNMTYLATNFGGLIALIIVAFLFLPIFYRRGVTSIYEILGHECGAPARKMASAMFMLGRVFASGARLYMVAIPFSLITFGTIEATHLVISILTISIVAALYTSVGGIRAVIWTDVLQAALLVATVIVALVILLDRIPLDWSKIISTLQETDVAGGSKVTVIDTGLSVERQFTLLGCFTGWTLFLLAAFGTDQDLVQRMLTCRSARAGGWSAILSNLLTWPIVALFLFIGALLFIFFRRPDLMGVEHALDDSRKVLLEFILAEIGPGLRGLMIAGLFAAAMSSLDSALNAMASTTIADFYRPWRVKRGRLSSSDSDADERRLSRVMVVVWTIVLACFACFCVLWYEQDKKNETLVNFALNVMLYAYTGMLAVFVTALFTRRGSARSVAAAFATGFTLTLLMERQVWQMWAPGLGITIKEIALPWKMMIATTASFVVCLAGKRIHRGDAENAEKKMY